MKNLFLIVTLLLTSGCLDRTLGEISESASCESLSPKYGDTFKIKSGFYEGYEFIPSSEGPFSMIGVVDLGNLSWRLDVEIKCSDLKKVDPK